MATPTDLLTALGNVQVNKADLVALLGAIRNPGPAVLGLRLRSDPLNSTTTVRLDRADVITMDDGERVPDWDDLTAAITSSGAGGLDTGAEAASTHYPIYAIRKSTDGTKGLLLHAAKDYFTDSGQSFTTTDDAARALRLSTGTATDKLAQSFQSTAAASQGPIDVAVVKLARTGAVSGSISLTIEADSAGSPSGTPLATSHSIDASAISTSDIFILFEFPTPFTPTASTTYWLVLQGTYTKSDTVFIAWHGVNAGGYANGSAKQFNGSAWSAATGVGDFNFTIYTTRNDTAVTMPTGYDQKALIGYVYNDGSSNFRPFLTRDRRTRYQAIIAGGTFTDTIPTLRDARAAFPPVPVMMRGYIGNGTDETLVWLGGAPHAYTLTTSIGVFAASYKADSANPQVAFEGEPTAFPFYYSMVSGGTGQIWISGYDW